MMVKSGSDMQINTDDRQYDEDVFSTLPLVCIMGTACRQSDVCHTIYTVNVVYATIDHTEYKRTNLVHMLCNFVSLVLQIPHSLSSKPLFLSFSQRKLVTLGKR